MRPALTHRLTGFGTSIFTEMTRLANETGAINLAQGFPDFDGPDFITSAAAKASREKPGQYTRSAGLLSLVQTIATRYQTRGISINPETDITVTCGATQAIFSVISALIDVGDEVVLIEPFYDSYRASVCMAGGQVRTVQLEPPDFSLEKAKLQQAITPRTKLILVNTPHNPTGRVFTKEELTIVAELCIENDLYCLSDEVYEELVYGHSHISIASLPGMADRTITISSLSKTFSLTGWRVGWAIACAPITQAIRCAHQFITFAAPTPLQYAAIDALQAPESYFEQLRSSYRTKRKIVVDALTQAGLSVYQPQGAYFVCAGFTHTGITSDVDFCRYLIEKVGVAAIPPSAFFDPPSRTAPYVRFVFCKQDETLKKAAERLVNL